MICNLIMDNKVKEATKKCSCLQVSSINAAEKDIKGSKKTIFVLGYLVTLGVLCEAPQPPGDQSSAGPSCSTAALQRLVAGPGDPDTVLQVGCSCTTCHHSLSPRHVPRAAASIHHHL